MAAQPTFRSDGVSQLFSFPYWLFVDTENPPQVKEITLDGFRLRLYPPFRSAPANFIPMPAINPHRIPFLPHLNVNFAPESELPTLAAIPKFGVDAAGKVSMALIETPDFPEEYKVFPMDSLRLDVFGGGDEDRAIDKGQEAVAQLIQLLRSHSRQWWVEHTGADGTLRNVFPVKADGMPDGGYPDRYSRGATVTEDVKAIDEELWQKSVSDLQGGVVTPLYDMLVLDARYFAVTNNIRRSVLDAAIACEQARDVHLERLWNAKTGGVPFKASRVIPGNNLPGHLSKDMERFVGRSYEKEYPGQYAVIEDLWDARGSIAHGRPSQFFRGGRAHTVTGEEAKAFSSAAEHCVGWLEGL